MESCCSISDIIMIKKPAIRKVLFASEGDRMAPLHYGDDSCDPTEFWYSESDIMAFRAEARDTCRMFQQQQQQQQRQCTGGINVELSAAAVEEEELCLQGLGFLLSNERKQNRVLANRGILKTQQCCCKNPELLATIAQELTAWATEVARCTAIINYYEVYFPTRCCEQLRQQKVTVPCPLSALRKRLHNDEATNQRSVRQCRGGPLEVQV